MRSTPAGILVLAAAAIVGWGCDTVAGPATPDALPLAALRGQAAFTRECAPCHASGDAVDLAFFNFTDTTIVRRAVAHVDTATALDIVAFVHTRSVPRASRSLRLFQPGALVLGGDAAFAAALFGADQWPADLTTQDLQAIDPLQVKAAVPLPLWSQENGNLDWMPDTPLPVAILDDQEGRARARLTAYRASSTIENLMAAVAALRGADRRLDNPGAPCLFDVVDRVPDYISCFEVRRWTSTLAAQHMIRRGMTGRLHRAAHAVWWDVGNAARKAVHAGVALAQGERNWASWMYLGWIFEPGGFPSVYTGNGLLRIGLPRHAAFVALRSEVARPAGSITPYADAEFAARFAPAHWTVNVVRFGYAHLLERLRRGDLPPADRLVEARARVDSAYAVAARKVVADYRPALRHLADEVLTALH
jgi:hypothetical protein